MELLGALEKSATLIVFFLLKLGEFQLWVPKDQGRSARHWEQRRAEQLKIKISQAFKMVLNGVGTKTIREIGIVEYPEVEGTVRIIKSKSWP